MKEQLDAQQEMLLELLETKSFDELSESEKTMVLSLMTQESYEQQHVLIMESTTLDEDVEPLPLLFEKEREPLMLPWYYSVAGVAAAVLVSFFIFGGQPVERIVTERTKYLASDTVFVEKRTTDTVVDYRTQYVVRTVNKEANREKESVYSDAPVQVPVLNTRDLRNRGKSVNQDNTYALVKDIVTTRSPILMSD